VFDHVLRIAEREGLDLESGPASDEAVLALTNTGYGGAVSGEAKQGGIGVSGQSNYIGVSGYSPTGTGVQGGGSTRGVYGLSDVGAGVEGGHSQQVGRSPGVYGWSASGATGAMGVFGELTSATAGDSSAAVKGKNDGVGFATITLPEYFAEINKDPRYALTVVNEGGTDFVQTMVVQKIRDNRFVIRTSKPSIEVSWEVKAVRNDLWVRSAGAPVMQEKQSFERGKYQHPELYGMPKEMGINYRP